MKVIVFDIGKTLMEYQNMPNVWTEYYYNAFTYICKKHNLNINNKDIIKAVEIMTSYNPTINYRENEFSPEFIFSKSIEHWHVEVNIENIINDFFESMHLNALIYSETIPTLKRLRKKNYKIAALTDIVTGMPDKTNKTFISELMPYFDYYVSSLSCGYRKPNPKGLENISKYFQVKKNELIYIGDEKKDIQVAERFGCKSVLIDRNNTNNYCGQDYTITNLSQLISLIDQ